ncbi:MAG: hypothetical protein R3277_08350, partial [Brumimicrobium sp.]|nr:hypothetical protein [Brumimicrobium sp.]
MSPFIHNYFLRYFHPLVIQFGLSGLLLIFSGACATQYTPIETFQERDENRHKKTEAYIKEKFPGKEYKSLAFGKTIVYKPSSFEILDSLFTVREEYIDKGEIRELKTSGVEEMIAAYKPVAERDAHLVQYEHEHIYKFVKGSNHSVHHDYFLFNSKDSLLTHTPLYSYEIPAKWSELHNSYIFEFHFITDRDLYISGRERDFLDFFKSREQALIGEDELQDFMVHTLKIMNYARQINSIDYSELTKYIAASG